MSDATARVGMTVTDRTVEGIREVLAGKMRWHSPLLFAGPEIYGAAKLSTIAIAAQTDASVFCPTSMSTTARIKNAMAIRLRVARRSFTCASTLVGVERVA